MADKVVADEPAARNGTYGQITDDAVARLREGIAAFAQKRPAEFTGR